MDSDNYAWLNRVAIKLNKLHIDGCYFDEHRWIFDWDKNLTDNDNLTNVRAEDRALETFKQAKAIKSRSYENFFRDQQLESFADPLRGFSIWGDRWEKTDPAHREYDYIIYIDRFDYDRFIHFCEIQGISYTKNAILATLEIANQTPKVRVGNNKYTFSTLRGGSTLDIIEQIRANSHFNTPTSFDDLRRWLKNPNAFAEQKNFNQIFREGNVFKEGNALSPFADILVNTFTLKSQALLTPTQLTAIQKNSIK